MSNPAMYNNGILPTPRMPIEDLTVEHLLDKLGEVEQSMSINKENGGEALKLEDTTFTLVTYSPSLAAKPSKKKAHKKVGARPQGMSSRHEVCIWTWTEHKRCIINPLRPSYKLPPEWDFCCLPLSIIIAKRRNEMCPPNQPQLPQEGRFSHFPQSRACKDATKKLIKDAGLQGLGPFEVADIGRMRAVLGAEYQINVYDKDAPPIAQFGLSTAPHHLNLLIKGGYSDNNALAHCAAIISMKAFMGKDFFCKLCKKTGDSEAAHKCGEAKCKDCSLPNCTNEGPRSFTNFCQCTGCNFTFATAGCFEAHKVTKCSKLKMCLKCYKAFPPAALDKHKCGFDYCLQCQIHHISTEYCYVRAVKSKAVPQDTGEDIQQESGEEDGEEDGEEEEEDGEEEEEGGEEEEEGEAVSSEEEEVSSGEDSSGDGSSGEDESSGEGSSGEDGSSVQDGQEAGEEEGQEAGEEGEAGAEEAEEEVEGEDVCSGEEEEEEEPVNIRKKKEKKKKKEKVIWYADAETVQDPDTNLHHANLVILQKPKADGGYEEKVYKGDDAMKAFTRDCVKKKSPFFDSTVVWHNGGKFDAHLWLKELMLLEMPPKLILKQQTIISMNLRQNKIKCRDSLQFVPATPLADFPKTFGLSCGSKGDFPHGLNTDEWVKFGERVVYSEEGRRFPKLRYFYPNQKKPGKKEELLKWHKEQKAKFRADHTLEYIPAEELESYCRQDVRILREGFEVYRKDWLTSYPDMEPLDWLTFPSYNNAIFRTKYMEPKSICMLPPEGFNYKNHPGSRESYAWLSIMKKRLGLKSLRHGRKGFEVKIAGLKVDGHGVDEHGNVHVFQYHGCHWHGCPCLEERVDRATGQHRERTEEQMVHYVNTLENNERLEKASQEEPFGPFTFHCIWAHDWYKERASEELRAQVKRFHLLWEKNPLRPRDSLHGGRTNCIKHKVEVDWRAGWRLHYLDYTSLYPAVMFGTSGETWPLGMPDIYIGDEVDEAPALADAFGLWKVKVHPPRELLQPVLGETIDGKFVFHLCSRCARESQQSVCSHVEADRQIEGTFFTGELQKAVEKGYRVERPSEQWDWPPEKRDDAMFKGMIRDQYGRKAMASEVPADPAEFDRLLQMFEDTMGLHLDKFSLNNIWGFFAKRNDCTSTIFTNNQEEINALVNKPGTEVTSMRVVMDGKFLQVQSKPEVEPAGKGGNIVLAAITTAYARLALYKLLDQYSEEMVYFDTDSVFILLPPGTPPPPTSTVLGGLKDEIHEAFGPDHFISSFHSLGPKSYTYTVVNKEGEVVFVEQKTKGISLSCDALTTATPEQMRLLVEDRDEEVRVPQFQIGRTLLKGQLFSKNYTKRLAFASTKRWFPQGPNPQLATLPFGYSPLSPDDKLDQVLDMLMLDSDSE